MAQTKVWTPKNISLTLQDYQLGFLVNKVDDGLSTLSTGAWERGIAVFN